MKFTTGAILIAVTVVPAAMAAIQFDSKVVEVRADPGTDKVTAKFNYKNTGSTREWIQDIETHCGCLSAKADRTNLAPGETGTITAVFNTRGKSGRFGKTLSVISGSTSGGGFLGFGFGKPENSTVLEVRVSIPELVILEPNVVSWKVGEKPTPKTVRVAMNNQSPIRVLKVESSRPSVGASLATVKEGKTYEIKITPQSTSNALLGVVRLDTDAPIPEQRRQLVFFRIEK